MLGSITDSLMGEPQAVHCGPWFCLSSMCRSLSRFLVRRPEFAGEPAGHLRVEGIRCNNPDLNLVAFGAFEQPVFEANWSYRNAFKHHPRLATRTASALNIGQEWVG
jgi:hypothetical protein